MLIKNTSALLGHDLEYVEQTRVRAGGTFSGIGAGLRPRSGEETLDCEGLLMIPGLVNCHTHVGDSIGKDVTLNDSVDNKIHPVFGAKSKILSTTDSGHLVSFMRSTCQSMIQKGITTFVDFREGGTEGVSLLKKAVSALPIRTIILGRTGQYHDARQIRSNERFPRSKVGELDSLLGACDGLGISGANENSTAQLRLYSRTAKLRAIHAAETRASISTSKKMTDRSEVERALEAKPHFMVHMTYASPSELDAAAKRIRGIVVCPRANASLAEGIPDIELMLKSGVNLALGTDNVMINSPDMFREMDYIWKVTMGLKRRRIDPRIILQMATVNAGRILGKNVGVIDRNMLADAVFLDKHAIDLEPMHSPHASIVHRASETSVRAVMIGGRIIHGRI